jgi:mono/diheme cytochrome c family protein
VSRLTAIPAPPAEPPATPGVRSTAPRVAGANIARGQQIYEQACVICHGADGKGGHGGGAPLNAVTDLETAIRTVTAGRDNMPPFGTTFTPEQIRDVSAYVITALAGGAAK